MSQTVTDGVRWTTSDIDLLPDNGGTRYEIVDGELFMTRAPWEASGNVSQYWYKLKTWSRASGLGQVTINPGILFTDTDNVIRTWFGLAMND